MEELWRVFMAWIAKVGVLALMAEIESHHLDFREYKA